MGSEILCFSRGRYATLQHKAEIEMGGGVVWLQQ